MFLGAFKVYSCKRIHRRIDYYSEVKLFIISHNEQLCLISAARAAKIFSIDIIHIEYLLICSTCLLDYDSRTIFPHMLYFSFLTCIPHPLLFMVLSALCLHVFIKRCVNMKIKYVVSYISNKNSRKSVDKVILENS